VKASRSAARKRLTMGLTFGSLNSFFKFDHMPVHDSGLSKIRAALTEAAHPCYFSVESTAGQDRRGHYQPRTGRWYPDSRQVLNQLRERAQFFS
jgi:hypothetical protein